jgi:hypothetical protein
MCGATPQNESGDVTETTDSKDEVMVSYYVFSALAAQREDEIERQAALAQRRRVHAQRSITTGRLPRERRLHWRRNRRLRAV